MKNKVYINITNHCNLTCPFCCMYSSPYKKTFMDINTFKNIIDKYDSKSTIIQLEGGEPFTHPLLENFLYYLNSKSFTSVIDTNGTLLKDLTHRTTIKVSLNTHVLKYYDLQSLKKLSYFNKLQFNVRYSSIKEYIYLKWITFSFRNQCNYHYFNKYGRASNSKLPELNIQKVYSNWEVYASDGKCFNNNLIARAEYEHIKD